MIWLWSICELWEVTDRARTVDKVCYRSVLAEIHILEAFQL